MPKAMTEFRGKDSYVINDELLRTPSYTTYLSTARQTGVRFMVKVLDAHRHRLNTWLDREAKALSGLNSPRIVRLHDYGLTETDQFFLVLEDVQGRLLSEWMQGREQVDEFTALRFLQQLALALKDISPLRIVHQGIDPTAIFVCPSPSIQEEILVKLWDFGLAQTRQNAQFAETADGFKRLGFLAPEQVTNQPVDSRTDIYGIGAVVYWMLTGMAPYEAESPMQLFRKIGREDVMPPVLADLRPDLSVDALHVLDRCLAYEPERRFASPEQLLKSLQIRSNRLDYLYDRAGRAAQRSAWQEVLEIADNAKELTGARVRFRDLVRQAQRMLDEKKHP